MEPEKTEDEVKQTHEAETQKKWIIALAVVFGAVVCSPPASLSVN